MTDNKGGIYIKEIDFIKEIEDICFREEAWSLEALRSSLQREDIVYGLVHDEAGTPTGYFIAAVSFEEAELYRIAVIPEKRGMGYGKKLMDRFLKSCPQKTERVFLEVRESNVPAVRLYESFGFKVMGRRKKYYGNEDALNYTLILNNNG